MYVALLLLDTAALSTVYQTVIQAWWNKPNQEFICQIGTFSDPFDSYLIYNALMDKTHGFRSAVFGWDTVHLDKPSDDQISKLFEGHGKFITSYIKLLEIHIVPSDKSLLLGVATFLDPQLSSPNFNATPPCKSHLNKRITNRYYLSANYLPPGSGPTLWTPLPCFLQNSLPYVIVDTPSINLNFTT